MDKENSYNFIKKFNEITIKNICEKININHTNVCAGTTSKENLDKVKNEIIKSIGKLLSEV